MHEITHKLQQQVQQI